MLLFAQQQPNTETCSASNAMHCNDSAHVFGSDGDTLSIRSDGAHTLGTYGTIQ